MTQLEFLRPIDELNQTAREIPIVAGRVVQVQSGRDLPHQKRILVIDDFDTSYRTTVAEAVCTESAVKAVTCALQVQFGAEKVVERGEFIGGQTGVRYPLPKSGHAARYPNIISEDTIAERRQKELEAPAGRKWREKYRRQCHTKSDELEQTESQLTLW